ncbi:MAG: D-erythro-7,8-dihydroneopterin triphosphate epimerase [Candidatus Hydrogenedentota bacterium]|jgi:dihydroneopterin aldolase/D-erythro-7,8-dihydroneopterin triphosphate epimerase
MTDTTLDRIHIRDLSTRCIVGIYPEERENLQEVILNITLHADLRGAGSSDRIEDTINYKDIKKKLLAMVESSQFFLVEKMAEECAKLCLTDPRVRRADVSVDKPGALRFARSVAVEITRLQQD